MPITVPAVRLSNGIKMPLMGLGSWLSKPEEVGASVRHALAAGYRHLDTAALYKNEKEVGDAMHDFLNKNKNVHRDDIFVTTKLWCSHNRPEEVEGQLRESLKQLSLDYVDLYLIHMPTCFTNDMKKQDHSVKVEDTWKGMEGVYKKGLTKAIGVSNFSIDQVERIQKVATIKIHNLQVECHLYFPQLELHKVCQNHNIAFTSYGPLGSPGRTGATVGGKEFEWAARPNPMDDEVVKKLAAKYHKTPAQILLRYLLQRDIIVIPKSIKEPRIRENFNVFDFSMTTDEMKELNETALKHKQRFFLLDYMAGHPEDPFKEDR